MARSADTRGWLKEPRFDLIFILGITALACAMGTAASIKPSLFLPLLLVHTWLFGFDHVIATYTKLIGLPADRRRNRWLILALPPVVFALVFVIGQWRGAGVLNTVYIFLQWFHTTRQSWGIAQHYRRAAGERMSWDPPWLSELTIWSIPVVGLLHRCAAQPQKFLYMDLYLPRVPELAVVVTGAIATILVAVFVVTRVLAWRRGELSVPHTLFVLTHFVIFGMAYLVIDDLQAGWLVVNVWHNVQYLAYVWMHNRARFEGGAFEREAPILSWLCQPGVKRGIGYFVACLVISCPLFGAIYAVSDRLDVILQGKLISISLVIALGINFHHYIVDGIIWKRARR